MIHTVLCGADGYRCDGCLVYAVSNRLQLRGMDLRVRVQARQQGPGRGDCGGASSVCKTIPRYGDEGLAV